MKKITKLCLLVAAVFGGFGIVLCGVGFVLGGGASVVSAMRNSFFANPFIHSYSGKEEVAAVQYSDDEYLSEDVGEMADYGQSYEEADNSEMPYKFAADSVKGLDIELSWGTLNVSVSEDDNIYVQLNGGSGKCTVKNGILEMEELSADDVELFVPANYVFQTVDIESDSGNLSAEAIKASGHVELSTDVGEITVNRLEAGSASISTDSGIITVDSSKVAGNTELEADAGNIEYWPEGLSTDYNYFISADIGSVSVDGETLSGFSQKRTIDNGAKVQINAEADVGNIDIYFK